MTDLGDINPRVECFGRRYRMLQRRFTADGRLIVELEPWEWREPTSDDDGSGAVRPG